MFTNGMSSSLFLRAHKCQQLVAQRGVVAQRARPARRSAPRPSPAHRPGRPAPARSRRPARRAGSSGPGASARRPARSRCSTTSGASPSDGSSSSSSSGLPISVRAIVSICCSPPDRKPPCRSRKLAQLGEQLVHALDGPRPPRGRTRAARDVEILPHRQLGEDAAVLGHEADAGARHPVGRPAGDVAPLPHDAARASAASGP